MTPGALIGLSDPYVAYCVSEAAAIAGLAAERRQAEDVPASNGHAAPPRWHKSGLLVGTIPVIRDD